MLLGGEAAVSDRVREQLGDGYEYVRLGGADRYETSAVVAGWACTHGLSWERPLVATGKGFADALAGSALAGKTHSPLLLADGAGERAAEALRAHSSEAESIIVLGGEAAVSESLANTLAEAV